MSVAMNGNGKGFSEMSIGLIAIAIFTIMLGLMGYVDNAQRDAISKEATGVSWSNLSDMSCSEQFSALKSKYSEKFGTGTNSVLYETFAGRVPEKYVTEIGGGVRGTDPNGIKVFVKSEKKDYSDCSVAFVNSGAVSEFRFCRDKNNSGYDFSDCKTVSGIGWYMKDSAKSLDRQKELSDKFVPPKENEYGEIK